MTEKNQKPNDRGFTAQQKKELVDIIGTTMSPYFTKVYSTLNSEIGKLRSEIGEVRSELRSEIGQLRKDMIEQKEELKSYIAVQVKALRYDFKATTETTQLHAAKINDHEKRMTQLEKSV